MLNWQVDIRREEGMTRWEASRVQKHEAQRTLGVWAAEQARGRVAGTSSAGSLCQAKGFRVDPADC